MDEANAFVVDDAGNVWVTGYSQDTVNDFDYATVKYDPSGNEQWVARYDGPSHGYDEARAIIRDGAGNIFVTGSSTGDGTRGDYATVRYDAAGQFNWVLRYDGPVSRLDEPVALAIDPNGLYVTGTSEGAGTGSDFATLRYPGIGAIEERPMANAKAAGTITTIAGRLITATAPGLLVDISGRTAMKLAAGANDCTRLRPGVYFARSAAGDRAAKLVVGD